MSSPSLLDKLYHAILTRMVKSGQAPHYTELAGELKVPVEEARKALHDLVSAGNSRNLVISRHGLYQQFCTVQQSPHPISNHGGW